MSADAQISQPTAVSRAGAGPIAVSVARVEHLLTDARAAGVDIAAVLREASLERLLEPHEPSGTVALADYCRLQNQLSIAYGDETMHLSARQLVSGSTDFVLQKARDCETLLDLMKVVARSYNILHGGEFNRVEIRRGCVDYVIDDREFPYQAGQPLEFLCFQIECTLIFLHSILLLAAEGAAPSVIGLQLRRPSPGGDCGHLGYWDAPIRFGADVYRVTFERRTGSRPIDRRTAQNLTLNAVYRRMIDAVAGRAARLQGATPAEARVRDALRRGVAEQDAVAAQMGMSVATLRRRLQAEGSTFRALRAEVLNAVAQDALRDGRSVAYVSEKLGFSEVRAFNRAFKDWNGVTPRTFQTTLDKPIPEGPATPGAPTRRG